MLHAAERPLKYRYLTLLVICTLSLSPGSTDMEQNKTVLDLDFTHCAVFLLAQFGLQRT